MSKAPSDTRSMAGCSLWCVTLKHWLSGIIIFAGRANSLEASRAAHSLLCMVFFRFFKSLSAFVSYGIFWNDSGMFCRLPQVPQGRGSGLWAKARQVLPVRLLSWFSERLLTIILRWCLTLLPASSYSVWALWFPWHPFGVCTPAQIRFFWAKQCATWKWLYSNATSEMQKRCFIPRAAYFSKFCASSCGLHQSQLSQYTNTHSLTHTHTQTQSFAITLHSNSSQHPAATASGFGVEGSSVSLAT